MIGWLVAGAVLAALATTLAVAQFNRMTVRRNRVRESWGNVGAELQRRHELVPNLVRAVQGYMAHEQQVLQAVVQARAQALASRGDLRRNVPAEDRLEQAVTRLLAVAEGYPRLRASANFAQLQQELAITEDRIAAARRYYNANVRDYRDATRQFPGVLFAALFGFRGLPFFGADGAAARAPVLAGAAFQRAGA